MRILTPPYLAGLFDGEGCVSISKYHPVYSSIIYQYCLRIYIVNTNKEIIDLLKFQFGGCITSSKRDLQKNKEAWSWQLVTDQALKFLELVYPYLIIKKKQAEVGMLFVRYKKAHIMTKKRLGTENAIIAHHELVYQQMKRLNRKGVIVS